ncbi:MAG: ABC transporter permease [Bacteroidota bacterium]|nr:ABC transporter permease [Bacteroidota bacterium]
MLLRLAWRNIWRNKRRSVLILASLVVGLIALILDDGFATGMIKQTLDNQINAYISHIQVHKAGFNANRIVTSVVPEPMRVERAIRSTPGIEAWCKRVVSFGLFSSAENSAGGMIIGIEKRETEVTNIARSITEGTFFTGEPHQIIIGKKLARKLNVGIGDKIVLMGSMRDGSVGSELFRVQGLFESFSAEFEKATVYIPLADAQRLFGLGDDVHEFAIRVRDIAAVDSVAGKISALLGDEWEALSYRVLLPLLVGQIGFYEEIFLIMYIIVGVAMIFGIINVMLMSVFERIREFGVLLATGMGTRTLFGMVMLEAFLLGVVGTVVGLALGLAIHARLAVVGYNLAMFAESMTSWGIGTIVYPELTPTMLVRQVFFLPLLCMAAAVYPAWKAVSLEPVRAIQHL